MPIDYPPELQLFSLATPALLAQHYRGILSNFRPTSNQRHRLNHGPPSSIVRGPLMHKAHAQACSYSSMSKSGKHK